MLSLFVIKLQAFRSETLLEKTSAQVFTFSTGVFFLRTPIWKNIRGRLLL